MALPEAHVPQNDNGGWHSPAGEPSVASSLERLVAGSQGVITKRIDLAVIEGQELLLRTLQRAALVALALALVTGAWFALAAFLVLVATPNANVVPRLAIFGLLNVGGALGLVALARRGRRETPVRANGNVSSAPQEP